MKGIRLFLAFFAVLVVLVIVRTTNKNLFKNDASGAVQAGQKNLVSVSQLKNRAGSFLVVSIDPEPVSHPFAAENTIHIPFEKLLEKDNRKKLQNEKGGILLYSADLALSSKAWVILNQLKFNNVYILSEEENPEEFKYTFQPDPSIRLE